MKYNLKNSPEWNLLSRTWITSMSDFSVHFGIDQVAGERQTGIKGEECVAGVEVQLVVRYDVFMMRWGNLGLLGWAIITSRVSFEGDGPPNSPGGTSTHEHLLVELRPQHTAGILPTFCVFWFKAVSFNCARKRSSSEAPLCAAF